MLLFLWASQYIIDVSRSGKEDLMLACPILWLLQFVKAFVIWQSVRSEWLRKKTLQLLKRLITYIPWGVYVYFFLWFLDISWILVVQQELLLLFGDHCLQSLLCFQRFCSAAASIIHVINSITMIIAMWSYLYTFSLWNGNVSFPGLLHGCTCERNDIWYLSSSTMIHSWQLQSHLVYLCPSLSPSFLQSSMASICVIHAGFCYIHATVVFRKYFRDQGLTGCA